MKSLICALTAVVILCAGCLPKPDGGFYWALRPPPSVHGDGLSYETAYRLYRMSEIELIRDKYWVTPQRAYEDFYYIVPPATASCYDSMQRSIVTRDKKTYEIVTFTLPEGRRTIYFDVTK